ncbi:MAG: hypothetical protein WDN00_15060 [Limisphaerales bacterium]
MPPFLEPIQREPGIPRGIQKIRDVMRVRRYAGGLFALGKIGHASCVLPERVQLADEEHSAFHQHARGFREYRLQLLHVFQHQIAGDEIGRLIGARPALGDVGEGKRDVRQVPAFFPAPS